MPRILLVDDEVHLRELLSGLLRRNGHTVAEAESPAAAREALAHQPFDLVITDQRMPSGTGQHVLATANEIDPTLPVIFLTAHATADLAVEVMREGAFDFITKPFIPSAVVASVKRACDHGMLARENVRLKREFTARRDDGLIGECAAMHEVRAMIAKVAPTNATVLITGETGTGKELAARAIHRASPRAEKPFVAVNCAALPESLLESELFGHEKGAFTGADAVRQGLFEAADTGSLLLDEAGDMGLALQAKLLRVLMDGEMMRVGSAKTRRVDVRVIVATHRDLKARVKQGLFREDLYYRLSVFPLELPALRARREDIPLLIQFLLTRVAIDLKIPPSGIRPEAVDALMGYSFPGNVRELRNLIERAYILSQGESLAPEHFPLSGGAGASSNAPRAGTLEGWLAGLPESVDMRKLLDDTERMLIERAMVAEGGNQTRAAERLSISRTDLAYKLKRLGMR